MAVTVETSPPPTVFRVPFTLPHTTEHARTSGLADYWLPDVFLLLFSGTFFLFSGSRTPHGRAPAARRPDGWCQHHVLSTVP